MAAVVAFAAAPIPGCLQKKPASTLSGAPDPAQRAIPTLTLFCGLPGSGKTTLAKRLEADGAGIRICTDDWQAELGVPQEDTDFHGRLQRVLYRHALTRTIRIVIRTGEQGAW
jgi:hypothetical protein